MAAPGRPTPIEIQQKLKTVALLKVTIQNLEKHIIRAREDCKSLETEIALYQASLAPISKCPIELLSLIFQFCRLDAQPWRIRHLLRVCKRWYNAAVSTPQIWSHITLTIHSKWDTQKQMKATNRYILQCLRRSGTLPLDINLNLARWRSKESLAVNKMIADCCPKCAPKERQRIYDTLLDSVCDAREYLSSVCNPTHVLRSISLLTGAHLEHLPRWRSLKVTLPEDDTDLCTGLWKHLRGLAPNLGKVAIIGPKTFFQSFDDDDAEEAYFLQAPIMKELEISGAIYRLDSLQINFHSVETMHLTDDLGKHPILNFSYFVSLRSLKVTHSPSTLPIGNRTPTRRIELPRLNRLTLVGGFTSLAGFSFVTPAMELLVIDREEVVYEGIPQIQADTVQWVTRRQKWKRQELLASLTVLLSHLPRSRVLELPSFMKPAADQAWGTFFHDIDASTVGWRALRWT